MAGDRTHYEGCWRAHHECAVAEVERLRAANLDAARLLARAERLEAIVRELAGRDPAAPDGHSYCALCEEGAPDHHPDCLWLQARQEVGDVG